MEHKPITKEHWNKEHIVSYGFGNDGETDAILEYKICKECNSRLGNSIETPFLRHVQSRQIQLDTGMKRRHAKQEPRITGSGVVVRFVTAGVHLYECIKIAFETHIKFLDDTFRDNTFSGLRQLLLNILNEYDMTREWYKALDANKRPWDEFGAETGQSVLFSKYAQTIHSYVFRLDELVTNSEDILSDLNTRSAKGSYASLVQLCCLCDKQFVLVCLQSLPPLAVLVSNQTDQYVKKYGRDGIFVMDLRSDKKWVGFEKTTDE